MIFNKQLLSDYNKKLESRNAMHRSTQERMEIRNAEAEKLKKIYLDKTSLITRLRSK